MPVTAVMAIGRDGGGEVGDVLWKRVLGADAGDTAFGGFAGFGEGIVARIEVFAFLGDGELRLEIFIWGTGRGWESGSWYGL